MISNGGNVLSNASLKHDSVIRVESIRKWYRAHPALDGVSVEFQLGKIHLLIGPNGSGKSTFLRCVMGLTRYEGTVSFDKRMKFGYAPEEYIMPDSMTIIEFLRCLGRIRRADPQAKLDEYLAYFDLINQKNHLISTLSNGMKQKINIIQAFIDEPNIILLDEPLRASRRRFGGEMHRTHPRKAARSVIHHFHARPGKISQSRRHPASARGRKDHRRMMLHFRFLFNKPIRRSLMLIASAFVAGLLFTAGVGDSSMAADLTAVRYPTHYWDDGWRIVRLLMTMISILLSSNLYSRQANRYSVYLISREYAKLRFVAERMGTLMIALTAIYALALALFVWIGNLLVVRFALSEPELHRFGYGWLILIMYANYVGIIQVWLDSPFAMLPSIGLLVLTIEPRIIDTISVSSFWTLIYRLVPAELNQGQEIILYTNLEWYTFLCVATILVVAAMFWWRDG
ncbi:MAG: ABC transporter ATP-binding protein [Bacillus subtilis]|nr:ABC transporter ATP-binding protein [Bacillus subtilis]